MKQLLIIASLAMVTVSSCTSKQQANQQSQAAAAQAKQAAIDSVNAANQQQKTIDSLKTVVAQKDETAKTQTKTVVEQPAASTVDKKKGWNSTTKGAVIGAGAGAVTGALVAKHKGAGAVVGGLIGAGAGAGTGAVIDNSKKKKEHQ